MLFNLNDLLQIFLKRDFYITIISILIGIAGSLMLKIDRFENHEIMLFLICFISSFLLITLVYIIFKKISKDRYVKYCPECDAAIGSKINDEFCRCGARYLTKCPKCKAKIKDNGQYKFRGYLNRICPACGATFETKPKTGLEWMAR